MHMPHTHSRWGLLFQFHGGNVGVKPSCRWTGVNGLGGLPGQIHMLFQPG